MNSLRIASLALRPKIFGLEKNSLNILTSSKIYSFSHINYSSQRNEESIKYKVYYGNLTPKMKAVKIFSLTTSLTGLMAQPILLEQGTKIGGTGMAIFLCGFAGFFTFVTPFLLHIITKNYVTELFYDANRDEYTANTISLLLKKVETKFKTTDVKVPEIPGMFTSILIGKTALFLDPTQFIDTHHYARIMGYDKPIDFKLESYKGSDSSSQNEIEKNK